MNDQKTWIVISGIFGFLGVAIGAFGAHGLKPSFSPEQLSTFDTGVMYHLIHAAVMTAIAVSGNVRFFRAEIFFGAGIVLFSFSLYADSITQIKWIAMITPLGGVCFLIGWIMLIGSAIVRRQM